MQQLAPLDNSHGRAMPKILAAVLIAVLAGLAAFFLWRSSAAGKVNDRLAALARDGYPTSAAELDQWHAAVPDDENAALLYEEAFQRMAPSDDLLEEALKRRSPRDPLSDDLRQWLESRMSENDEAIDALIRAATLDRCRYSIDMSLVTDVHLRHLAEIKEAARLLQQRAILAADMGDAEAATESVVAGLALANSLAQEPILISHLVWLAVDLIACATLEHCINQVELTDAQLRRLIAALGKAENPEGLARALIGERAMTTTSFRTIGAPAAPAGPGATLPPGNGSRFIRATGIVERDLRFFLDCMETNIALARLPPPANLDLKAAIDTQSERARQSFYFLTAMLLPALSKTAERTAQNSAHLRVATAALAIERFRLAHGGKFPDNLAQLMPDYLGTIPLDPFDGQPLRYRRTDGGYLVYSIGPDRKDDNGTTLRRKTGDVTFIVER